MSKDAYESLPQGNYVPEDILWLTCDPVNRGLDGDPSIRWRLGSPHQDPRLDTEPPETRAEELYELLVHAPGETEPWTASGVENLDETGASPYDIIVYRALAAASRDIECANYLADEIREGPDGKHAADRNVHFAATLATKGLAALFYTPDNDPLAAAKLISTGFDHFPAETFTPAVIETAKRALMFKRWSEVGATVLNTGLHLQRGSDASQRLSEFYADQQRYQETEVAPSLSRLMEDYNPRAFFHLSEILDNPFAEHTQLPDPANRLMLLRNALKAKILTREQTNENALLQTRASMQTAANLADAIIDTTLATLNSLKDIEHNYPNADPAEFHDLIGWIMLDRAKHPRGPEQYLNNLRKAEALFGEESELVLHIKMLQH